VFLWEEDFQTFNFDQYDPIKSNGVLRKEDLDLLERELKKTGYFKVGETAAMNMYIFPWVIWLVITVFVLYKYMEDTVNNDLALSIGIIALAFIVALGVTLLVRYKQNNKLKRREEAFKRVVKSLNRTIFQPKDVQCQVGMYGAFIMFDLQFKTSIQGDLEKALNNSRSDSIMDDTDINDLQVGSHSRYNRVSRSFVVASSSLQKPLFVDLLKNGDFIDEVEEPKD
jgi:hypothetical protein